VPKTLAEIALDERLADRRVLEDAARHAERANLPLVAAIVRHAGIDEVALVAAIRRQTRVPLTDPAGVVFDTDALRELPREVCERRRILPLSIEVPVMNDARPRTMRLAMADPSDAVAIAEVEHLTGCRVEPSVMTLSGVEELVDNAYRGIVTQVMQRNRDALYGDPGRETVVVPPDEPDEVVEPPWDRSTVAIPGRAQTTTSPYHRLADEAELSLRLEALVKLLVDKQLLSEGQYEEAIRQLMKGRVDDG
jgi:hypothetical protein